MTDEVSANSSVKVTQDAANFRWDDEKPQPGIGIALSGGGFRAMLFHAGALARMNELGLLSKAQRVASVSGGSIISGYLGMKGDDPSKSIANDTFANFKAILVEPILAFSRHKI